ncbi:MAG TPA: YqgE/AlgH family protein [Bryobacteraceae bacterium]|nr:YqgE/AlgH family protein [Bryobacteraceae bacterium]
MAARARFLALFAAGACCLAAQSKNPQDLAVGKILVSPSASPDPLFAESVILLVRYTPSDALGLMVNRQSKVAISEALRSVAGAAKHSEPVFVGGPVELDTVFALVRAPHGPEGSAAVAGDIHFIAVKTALEKELRRAANANGLRVYVGYCGWGPRQLDSEVRRGGWYIFSHSEDLSFDANPATLWTRLVGKAEGQSARLMLRPAP